MQQLGLALTILSFSTGDDFFAYTKYEPIGVCGAVIPVGNRSAILLNRINLCYCLRKIAAEFCKLHRT